MTQQQYLEPVPYYARNSSQLSKLQSEASELLDSLESEGADWVERSRASSRLQTVEREIQASRHGEGSMGEGPFQRRVEAAEQQQVVVRSDCGTCYSTVPATNVRGGGGREPERPQEFMPIASNTDPRGPESFAARTAVVAAACDEIRRKGMMA